MDSQQQQFRSLQIENAQLQQRIQQLQQQQSTSPTSDHEEENHRLNTALDTANSQILILTGTLKNLTKQYTDTHKELDQTELQNQELRAAIRTASTDAEAMRFRERQVREDAVQYRRNAETAKLKISELEERINTLTKQIKGYTSRTTPNNASPDTTVPSSVRKTPKGSISGAAPIVSPMTKSSSSFVHGKTGNSLFLTRTEANMEQKLQILQKRIQDLEKERDDKDNKVQELSEQLRNVNNLDKDTTMEPSGDLAPFGTNTSSIMIPSVYGIPLLAHLQAIQATLEEIKVQANIRKQKNSNVGNLNETNGKVSTSTPPKGSKSNAKVASPGSPRSIEDITPFIPSSETLNHLQSAIAIATQGSDLATREAATATLQTFLSSISNTNTTPTVYVPNDEALQRENISLLSTLAKISNNLTVFCRIRPLQTITNSVQLPQPPSLVPENTVTDQPVDARLSSSSLSLPSSSHVSVEALSDTDIGYWDRTNRAWRSFAFDHCYGPENTQEDIYRDSIPFIYSVLEGYTSCVLAYGITGSGKTHTMQGPVNDIGLNGRLVKKLFQLLHERYPQLSNPRDSSSDTVPVTENSSSVNPSPFNVRISMLEVYNEEVRDLLLPVGIAPVKLEIRTQDADNVNETGNSVKTVAIPGLTSIPVTNYQDALIVLARGYAIRAVAGNGYNEYSSRSHCIIRIDVESLMDTFTPFSAGRLYLADLAGSERVQKTATEGLRFRETQYINRSLAALGDVMEALEKKAAYVPYRNSKLTHILQDAFGGASSRALLICNVSPSLQAAEETLHTLRFATRVRTINLGSSQKLVSQRNIFEALSRAKQEITKVEQQQESLRKERDDAVRQRNEALNKLDVILRTEPHSAASSPNGSKSLTNVSNTQDQAQRALVAKLDATTAALSSARNELANLRRIFGVTESTDVLNKTLPENSTTRLSPTRNTAPNSTALAESLKKKEGYVFAVVERERRLAANQLLNDQREIAALRTQLADAKASLAYLRKQHTYTRTRHGDKERALQLEAIMALEPVQILQHVIPHDGTKPCPMCGHSIPEQSNVSNNAMEEESSPMKDNEEGNIVTNEEDNKNMKEGNENVPSTGNADTTGTAVPVPLSTTAAENVDNSIHDHSDLPPIGNNVLLENDLSPQKIDFSPSNVTESPVTNRIHPSLRSVATAVRTANRFTLSASEKRAQREAEATAIRKAVEEAEAHAREELRKRAKGRLRLAGNAVMASLAFGKSASSSVRTAVLPVIPSENNEAALKMSVTPIPTDNPVSTLSSTSLTIATESTDKNSKKNNDNMDMYAVFPVAVLNASPGDDNTFTATPIAPSTNNLISSEVPIAESMVISFTIPETVDTTTTTSVPVEDSLPTEEPATKTVDTTETLTEEDTQKLMNILSRMGWGPADDDTSSNTKKSRWNVIRKYTPDIVAATRAGYVFGGDDDEEKETKEKASTESTGTAPAVSSTLAPVVSNTTKPATVDSVSPSSTLPKSTVAGTTTVVSSSGTSALASASLDFGDDDDHHTSDHHQPTNSIEEDNRSLGSADTDDLLDLLPE